MATLVAGTVKAVASTSQIITGAYELSRRLVRLVRPPCLRLDPCEIHYVLCIQRQIESMIQPLEFCMLWSRHRDPLTQRTIWMVEDTLRRVWNRILCLENQQLIANTVATEKTRSESGTRSERSSHSYSNRRPRVSRYPDHSSRIINQSKCRYPKHSSFLSRVSSNTPSVTLLRWCVDELNIAASQLTLALSTVQAHCLARMQRGSYFSVFSTMAFNDSMEFSRGRRSSRNLCVSSKFQKTEALLYRNRLRTQVNECRRRNRRKRRRISGISSSLTHKSNSNSCCPHLSHSNQYCGSEISVSTLIKAAQHIWAMAGRTGDVCLSSGCLYLYNRNCFTPNIITERSCNISSNTLKSCRLSCPSSQSPMVDSSNSNTQVDSCKSLQPTPSSVDESFFSNDARNSNEWCYSSEFDLNNTSQWKCLYKKCFMRITKTVYKGLSSALIAIESANAGNNTPITTERTSSVLPVPQVSHQPLGTGASTGDSQQNVALGNNNYQQSKTIDIGQNYRSRCNSTVPRSAALQGCEPLMFPPSFPVDTDISCHSDSLNTTSIPNIGRLQLSQPLNSYRQRQQDILNPYDREPTSARDLTSTDCVPYYEEGSDEFLLVTADGGLGWQSDHAAHVSAANNSTLPLVPSSSGFEQSCQSGNDQSRGDLSRRQAGINSVSVKNVPNYETTIYSFNETRTHSPKVTASITATIDVSPLRSVVTHPENIERLPDRNSALADVLKPVVPSRLQFSISVALKMKLYSNGLLSSCRTQFFSPHDGENHAYGCTASSDAMARRFLPFSRENTSTNPGDHCTFRQRIPSFDANTEWVDEVIKEGKEKDLADVKCKPKTRKLDSQEGYKAGVFNAPALIWSMTRNDITQNNSVLGKQGSQWILELLKNKPKQNNYVRGGGRRYSEDQEEIQFAFVFDTQIGSSFPWNSVSSEMNPTVKTTTMEQLHARKNSTLPLLYGTSLQQPESSFYLQHHSVETNVDPSSTIHNRHHSDLARTLPLEQNLQLDFSPFTSITPLVRHRSLPPLQVLYIARLCFLEAASTLAGSKPNRMSTCLNCDFGTLDNSNTQKKKLNVNVEVGSSDYPITDTCKSTKSSIVEQELVTLSHNDVLLLHPRDSVSMNNCPYSNYDGQNDLSVIHQHNLLHLPREIENSPPTAVESPDKDVKVCHQTKNIWSRLSDEALLQLLSDCFSDW